jgi:hypothetical protein
MRCPRESSVTNSDRGWQPKRCATSSRLVSLQCSHVKACPTPSAWSSTSQQRRSPGEPRVAPCRAHASVLDGGSDGGGRADNTSHEQHTDRRIDAPHAVADRDRHAVNGSAIRSQRRMRCGEQGGRRRRYPHRKNSGNACVACPSSSDDSQPPPRIKVRSQQPRCLRTPCSGP